VCAFLDPAIEGNEGHTVSIIGHFGGRTDDTSPLSIQVTTDLKLYDNINNKEISAKSLMLEKSDGATIRDLVDTGGQYGFSFSYHSGLIMLNAIAYSFSTVGE